MEWRLLLLTPHRTVSHTPLTRDATAVQRSGADKQREGATQTSRRERRRENRGRTRMQTHGKQMRKKKKKNELDTHLLCVRM